MGGFRIFGISDGFEMKLWAPVLLNFLTPDVAAVEERLRAEFYTPIVNAHSMMRNAPLARDLEKGLRATERFAEEVFARSAAERNANVDELISSIRNLTSFETERSACNSRFPKIDGKCNHSSTGGQAMNPYERMQPAEYCDGVSSLRCGSDGKALPNARSISTFLQDQHPVKNRQNHERTHLMTTYGQFITHTAVQTPDMTGDGIECGCDSGEKNCVVVEVNKKKDPVFDDINCFFITRSSGTLQNQNGKMVREQINQLTGTVTAGAVYGFNEEHLDALRVPNSALLKTSKQDKGDFLPTLKDVKKIDKDLKGQFNVPTVFNDKGHPELFAGDNRVMENGILTFWHTMFVRLHNLCVEEMPSDAGDTERVFQECRMLVIGAMQQILYEEQLPALIGETAIANTPALQPSSALTPLDPNRDQPVIFNEFAAAAFRYGHSAQPEDLISKDSKFKKLTQTRLGDNFFDPDQVFTDGPGAMCRGAMTQNGIKPGPGFVDDTLHNFFKPNNFHHGVDLFSINISRGRDHGLAGYTKLKDFCENHDTYSVYYNGWAGMQSGYDDLINDFYKGVEDDVDLYVGLLMEEALSDGEVGPTTACIVAHQYINWKETDKWFYERTSFFETQDKLDTLKDLDLSKIICLTMENMDTVPTMPFIGDGVTFQGSQREFLSCSSHAPKLEMRAWKRSGDVTDSESDCRCPNDVLANVKNTNTGNPFEIVGSCTPQSAGSKSETWNAFCDANGNGEQDDDEESVSFVADKKCKKFKFKGASSLDCGDGDPVAVDCKCNIKPKDCPTCISECLVNEKKNMQM